MPGLQSPAKLVCKPVLQGHVSLSCLKSTATCFCILLIYLSCQRLPAVVHPEGAHSTRINAHLPAYASSAIVIHMPTTLLPCCGSVLRRAGMLHAVITAVASWHTNRVRSHVSTPREVATGRHSSSQFVVRHLPVMHTGSYCIPSQQLYVLFDES